MPGRLALPFFLALAVTALPFPGGAPVFPITAWAQDDDDDGDGSHGGGGSGVTGGNDDWSGGRAGPRRRARPGGGFSLDEFFGRWGERRAPRRSAPRGRRVRPEVALPPAPPPPEVLPGEIVVFDLTQADLDTLLARDYTVIETQGLATFGAIMRRLRVPDGIALADAREVVRALPSGGDADFNHLYRSEAATGEPPCEGPHCTGFDLVDWPLLPSLSNACGQEVAIGMIDTGINAAHETFAQSRLEVHRVSDEALDASRAIHGTAIAAILIGHPESRSPGLVPFARLVAVDVFHRSSADERADAFTLVEGLDLLAGADVAVVNLSLSGPANTVLERAVDEMVGRRGIVLVSAAGNGGPQAAPLYPGAYDEVIAVTAVDAARRVYRRAGRGAHIDLAAPGVGVWTAASIEGARPKTGTSFAVPFVSAASALILHEAPGLAPDEVTERLTAAATDLGEAGPDEIFGAGLLSLAGACRGAALID